MISRNIASVCWSDHLVFGEGDGKLASVDALTRRLKLWRDRLGVGTVLWRFTRARLQGRFSAARGHRHFFLAKSPRIDWDDFKVVPELCRSLGMACHLYMTIFDEGWPLAPKKVREVSYHNAMHYQHVSYQTEFARLHPDYAVADRTLSKRQWGVMCLAYREVRNHFIRRASRLLDSGTFDGLFVCLRSQSKPAAFADQFGFNEPVRHDYHERYSRDIRKEDFDLQAWRDLLGDYVTIFLTELRQALLDRNIPLGVGIPRGYVMGPPLGNANLQWAKWIREGLVDYLIVDQNSSRCPSMWHDLWPMHRGFGYVQNYVDGFNMIPLVDDLNLSYGPVFEGNRSRLYVARQWVDRSETEEHRLLSHPAVDGLVFSTFRFDNQRQISKGNWDA